MEKTREEQGFYLQDYQGNTQGNNQLKSSLRTLGNIHFQQVQFGTANGPVLNLGTTVVHSRDNVYYLRTSGPPEMKQKAILTVRGNR